MENILEIYEKALAGTATPDEMRQLRNWLAAPEHAAQAQALVEQSFFRTTVTVDLGEKKVQAILQAIVMADQPARRRVRILPFRRWWAAASILLLLAGGAAYYTLHHRPAPAPAPLVADAAPAHRGAVLTLSNGREIVLDSAQNGLLAAQNGARLLIDSGQLSYQPGATTQQAVAYNTISTHKGRQFSLQLPDGTLVWLNAASAVRYPTAFNGNERKVEVTGEVYFEVAPNSRQPFKVSVGRQATVEVLGTSFNINAYADDGRIHTTLVNGAVAVKNAGSRVVLKPGQAAILANDSSTAITINEHADISKALAWKNGAFNLEGASLKEVMKEVERWYDIEVVYEKGVIPDIYFTGQMSRHVKLTSFLKALKEWQINYRLENNRLVILP